MTVKCFVEYWNTHGFSVRVRTVGKMLTWCFTCQHCTFFIPASAIVHVAEAIAEAHK